MKPRHGIEYQRGVDTPFLPSPLPPPPLHSPLVLSVMSSGCFAGMHRAEARHKEDVCHEVHEQAEVRGEG